MKHSPLPDVMLGSWIWSSEELNQPKQEHALFRRDFILDAAPSSTEIQIAAHCAVQIYINGRFATYGTTPNPVGKQYICKYDISHMMQIGANSIAIRAFCDARPATSRPPKKTGFWLQILADNVPILWTDEKWLTYPLNAYKATDLQASPAETCVEILNYEEYPQNWLLLTQKHFSPEDNQLPDETPWQKVKYTWPLKQHSETLELVPRNKKSYEPTPAPTIVSRGQTYVRNGVISLDFAPLFTAKANPGIYVGETYLFLEEESRDTIFCFSATPYKIFINDQLGLQQPNVTPQSRYLLENPQEHCCQRLNNTQDEFEVTLQKGWNKIVVAKWCEETHSPFTIIFGNKYSSEVTIRRSPEINASMGWYIAGPLNAPLPLIPETFSIQNLPKMQYHNLDSSCQDAAAYSLACQFDPSPELQLDQKFPIPLSQQQTIIFDFGKTIYAVPEIKLSGQRGDILDVITGEHMIEHEVIALENGIRRNTSTIIIDDCPKPIMWLHKEKKGFRYMMLVARETRTVINIMAINAYVSVIDTNARGSFECDDDTLNAIWKAGVATLDTTFQGRFIDSPTKDQTQCIPDTMIQATSAYFTHGAYHQAATALEAFASTQLETGEINALTPSSFFQTIPDFSLMWPIWLQKHIQYTADTRLLQELMPTLTNLLDFYDSLAVEPNGPLGQVADFLGNQPFIDIDTIDTRGISTALNGLYCRALFSAAWLADFSDNEELSKICTRRAAKIAATVRQLNWNPEQQLFADAYVDASQSPYSSWQANVLAIYGGIATPDDIPAIWQQLFTTEEPYERFAQGEANNPYFKYFILDCAFAHGYGSWGLSLMRYYWGKMLKAGATTLWELFDPDNPALSRRIFSHCQAYATSPNAFLISEVAGLRPDSCGMNSLIFSPDLKDIKWCRASVPTPLGTIQLSWELRVNDILQISITANHPIDIIPVLSPKYAEKAIFNVSDTVSILAPDEDQLPDEEEQQLPDEEEQQLPDEEEQQLPDEEEQQQLSAEEELPQND